MSRSNQVITSVGYANMGALSDHRFSFNSGNDQVSKHLVQICLQQRIDETRFNNAEKVFRSIPENRETSE